MVLDVETEDNLVQLLVFDPDSLVTKRRWQLPQKVRKSARSHVQLTHWIVFSPCVSECFDIFFLECQNVVFVLSLLVVIETLTNNGNENVHENEEAEQSVGEPEE